MEQVDCEADPDDNFIFLHVFYRHRLCWNKRMSHAFLCAKSFTRN